MFGRKRINGLEGDFMKKLSDYVTIGEDGKPQFDETAFNADVDRERNSASETAKANAEKKLRETLTAEIKAKLEEEAKLSADEKLAKEREDFLKEKKEFQKSKIVSLYETSSLFTKDEIDIYTDEIGDDFAKATERATKIIEARKKHDEDYKKQLDEQYQAGTPRPNGAGSGGGKQETFAERKAKEYGSQNADDYVKL